MKLIIGLGNPGKEYEKTRHNAGFLAVERIARDPQFSAAADHRQKQTFNFQSKFNAEISHQIVGNEKVILAKPQTFMNSSGKAVKAIMDYYKVNSQDVVVIHDDLDIPLGKYKVSKNRGSAGHKGVQSIIDCLGTKDFTRIRIGIGTKGIDEKTLHRLPAFENEKRQGKEFVIEKFSKEEMEIIEEVVENITDSLADILAAYRDTK